MRNLKALLIALIFLFHISCPCPMLFGQSAFNVNLDTIRNSVVFLHRVDAQGQLKDAGTGFLINVPLTSDPKRAYILLVTARHIVDPVWSGCPATENALVALFNKAGYDPKKDATGTVELHLNGGWVYPADDSVDIAVTILNGQLLSTLGVENQGFSITQLPSHDEIKLVGSGSQIASAGLLLGASGSKRNYPIFKFGYVSSIPDEGIAVACCAGCSSKLRTQWMIAASLVPGNSGSPIVYVPSVFAALQASKTRPFLLGVQSTSFAGYDVAGMAPVQFLLDAIRSLNMPDADTTIPGEPAPAVQAHPTSTGPIPNAVPGPTPNPK